MSSSIDYYEAIAKCPDCDTEEEVTVVRDQDNKGGGVTYCISGMPECSECGHKFTMEDADENS